MSLHKCLLCLWSIHLPDPELIHLDLCIFWLKAFHETSSAERIENLSGREGGHAPALCYDVTFDFRKSHSQQGCRFS